MNFSLFGASNDKYNYLRKKRDSGWVKFAFNWYLKAVEVVELRMTRGWSFHSRIADGKKELKYLCIRMNCL